MISRVRGLNDTERHHRVVRHGGHLSTSSGGTVRRAIKRMTLIVVLALSMLIVVQAPAFAWVTMQDATLQVKKACIDGVRLDVGATSPRSLHEDPTTPLLPTVDVVIRGRVGEQVVLNDQVTLPLHPRAIKVDGEAKRIDYYKRFTLRWSQRLQVGQTVSLKDALESIPANDREAFFNDPRVLLPTTVKNCRLFR
jgi:hypothetical protein